jgi:hypothetical protein
VKPFIPAAIGILVLLAQDSFGQAIEVEINHPCVFAQDLGSLSLPHMITGTLDPLLPEGDVDFYKIDVTPHAGLQVDLEGRDAGGGTLRDPFLGLFDSSCRLLRLNDDGGSTSSRVLTFVPGDGVVIIAATSCCDHEFRGEVGVGGTYRVMIRPAELLRSIRGRAVDGVSGAPLPGSEFPFARAELYLCSAFECDDQVQSDGVSSQGEFGFGTDFSGTPLFAARYQVRLSADHYRDLESFPFDVAAGEEKDLGDLALTPLARIGSITGRVIDAVTRSALSGADPPFVHVRLERCESGFCSFTDSTNADDQGRYSFGDDPFRLLEPGDYRVEAEAEEYRPAETALVSVAEGEDAVLDDLPLDPFPIGFSEIRACGDLPRQGGVCNFSVRVVNRSTQRIAGGAWSLVDSSSTGSLTGMTRFQAGTPKMLVLPPLGSRVVPFSFRVPASIENGGSVCAEVFFGQGRADFLFNTVGTRNLFCIQKGVNGTLRILDVKESRALRSKVEPGPRRSRNRR